MTGMDDLVTWLRAQLDEDEYIARRAGDHGWQWRAADPGIYPSDESRHPGPIVSGVWGELEDQYARHIAHWDPARVLAEVDAKRRILDEVGKERDQLERSGYRPTDVSPALARLHRVARFLALPYAERDGYREEWRP